MLGGGAIGWLYLGQSFQGGKVSPRPIILYVVWCEDPRAGASSDPQVSIVESFYDSPTGDVVSTATITFTVTSPQPAYVRIVESCPTPGEVG